MLLPSSSSSFRVKPPENPRENQPFFTTSLFLHVEFLDQKWSFECAKLFPISQASHWYLFQRISAGLIFSLKFFSNVRASKGKQWLPFSNHGFIEPIIAQSSCMQGFLWRNPFFSKILGFWTLFMGLLVDWSSARERCVRRSSLSAFWAKASNWLEYGCACNVLWVSNLISRFLSSLLNLVLFGSLAY